MATTGAAMIQISPMLGRATGAPTRSVEPGPSALGPGSAPQVCVCGCGERSPLLLTEAGWLWLGHLPPFR